MCFLFGHITPIAISLLSIMFFHGIVAMNWQIRGMFIVYSEASDMFPVMLLHLDWYTEGLLYKAVQNVFQMEYACSVTALF